MLTKLLVVVDCVQGVISVETGELKCFICHSSICFHCNYISSFDRLDRLPLFVLQRCLATIDLKMIEYLLLCHIKEFHTKLTKSAN